LLSRRIHRRYVELKEQALGSSGIEPRPVIIVLEEAHKFLSPGIANQTIFGTIARELRKYNVTLMVIDQRPSAIDSEVMSQLGTRLTCLLDNERDVDSVLSGMSGSRQLRTVLSRMEPKQQALLFGHAVPMPIVIKTRDYGTLEFYSSITNEETLQQEIDELF
jgi:DNA helicase HerA-like ATPase